MMRARLLGRFEIQASGKALALRLRQEQGLLAYLLLNHGQSHRRERLAGLFWPEAGEANARSSLRHALWRIRKAFDENGAADRLEADDLTICLRLQPGDWLDVAELEAPVQPEHRTEDLARQVQAYGGELLPGFYDDWVLLERQRLAGLYERKLGELLEALLAQARWSEAAAWAEQWIAQGGAPEPAYRALMLARAAQGNLAPDAVVPVTESPARPTLAGTVTFLFTDIAGSTRLLDQLHEAYALLLAEHHRIMQECITRWKGVVVDTQGDAFFASFSRASDALACVIQAQHRLAGHPWPQGAVVQVRMGLHTGEPVIAKTGYVGMDVHRAARIAAAGHGGQVLLSQTTRDLVFQDLPPGTRLRELGTYKLKDIRYPQVIFQLEIDGLPINFPPLKTVQEFPNNLPLQLTSFVGREDEIAEIKQLMGKTRLLTLTGPGGCGKTRLALQAANGLLDRFPDGVWLVEFASLADPALIPQSVAGVLGIQEMPGTAIIQALAAYLHHKSIMLILDNCEHIIEGVANWVEPLLQT